MAKRKRDDAKNTTDLLRQKTRGGAKLPWFALEGAAAATAMCDHVDGLRRTELSAYRTRVLQNMRLYEGGSVLNGVDSKAGTKQLQFNLGRSIVDTGAAVLCAARTLPFVQTRGADFRKRRKAMRLNQGLQTQYQQVGVFDEALQAIPDALIGGLGVIKFFEDSDKDGGTASCQRLLPLSTVWDPTEAASGSPRNIFHVDLIARDTVIENWCRNEDGSINHELADKVLKAPGASSIDLTDFQLTRSGTANQVVVVEGWHLPSSAEAGDGRHMIAIPGLALHEEEWKRPRFPLGMLHGWSPGQLGFTGTSLIDLVKPAQRYLEELADHVKKCRRLGSTPKWFVPKASNVEPGQITNAAVEIIPYEGAQPPTMVVYSGTPVDLEQARAQIREETLSMLGLSTSQVQGEKPAGLTSAVAQRTYEDISSKRHVVNLRHIEKFYLDCAQALVDTNNAIAADKPDFAIDSNARATWLDAYKWRELMMSDSEALMAVLPVSQLVGSASAQFETAEQWVAAGWTTPQTAKLLAGHPDTEGQADEDTEDLTFANYLVDEILDDRIVNLDPFMSPDVFISVARPAYLRARREWAPPEVQDEFRRVLELARLAIQAATPDTTPTDVPQQAAAA